MEYIHFDTVNKIIFWDGSGTLVKKVSLEPWCKHSLHQDTLIS